MKNEILQQIKAFFRKKENLALLTMAMVLCAGIVITNVKNQVPLHDGDVLVDSQTVTDEKKAAENVMNDEETTSLKEKRASLDLERNQIIADYDETIKNSTNEAEQKDAVTQKKRLIQYMEQEVSIENILSTKNIPETLVIITDQSITVTVDEQELKQNLVTRICNVVMTETGRTADKIVIQSLY